VRRVGLGLELRVGASGAAEYQQEVPRKSLCFDWLCECSLGPVRCSAGTLTDDVLHVLHVYCAAVASWDSGDSRRAAGSVRVGGRVSRAGGEASPPLPRLERRRVIS